MRLRRTGGCPILCDIVILHGLDVFRPDHRRAGAGQAGGEQHGSRRLQRPAGRSAYQPPNRASAGSPTSATTAARSSTRHGQKEDNGTSMSTSPTRSGRIPRAHSGEPSRPGKAKRRRADGPRLRRQLAAAADQARSTCCAASADRRTKSGTSPIPASPSSLTAVVSGLRDTHKSWWECDTGIAYFVAGARLAHTPHDAVYDLCDPGEAGVHPQLRPAGPAAGRDRARCRPTARTIRAARATASISATAPARAAFCIRMW